MHYVSQKCCSEADWYEFWDLCASMQESEQNTLDDIEKMM